MWLARIQSRCKERSTHLHTHQDPSHQKGIPSILHYTTQHLMTLALGICPLGSEFQKLVKGSFSQSIRAISILFSSPRSLMLIKAECLISPRWSVNLNYLFVFVFTVSVCLQFFVSLWRSVIGACVSFWLEWLPDDTSWWYVDDLLIYGF